MVLAGVAAWDCSGGAGCSDPFPFLALRPGNRRPLGGRSSLRGFFPSYGRRSPLCSHLVHKQRPTVARGELLAKGPAGGTLPAVSVRPRVKGTMGWCAARAFSPSAQGRRGHSWSLDFSLALLLACARRVTSVVPSSVILGYCPSFDLILSN